jgi:hypothetical protein
MLSLWLGRVILLKDSCGFSSLPPMANGLPYSFLHKHNTKLHLEFVLWKTRVLVTALPTQVVCMHK